MTLFVLIAFAAMAGLCVGYLIARLLSFRAVWGLWAVCAAFALGGYLSSQRLEASGGFDSIVLLYGLIGPFIGCAVVASLLGLIARAALARAQAE